MSQIAKRTISLPPEQAAFIDEQVATGRYASASEVVRAGLHALRERDHAVERWLTDEVAAAYDNLAADPTRKIPAADAFAAVRNRHRARGQKGG